MENSILSKINKSFTYKGNKTNEISFPLGGIGTGCIGLAGNGRLVNWEIFNRPNRCWDTNGFSFFAIKAESAGYVNTAKILIGDLNSPYSGYGKEDYAGFGWGVKRESMSGLPHFKEVEFTGQFPFADIQFIDESVPLDIKLTAFNPFIPLNDFDSSLPAAVFVFEVTNKSPLTSEISLVANLNNPLKKGKINRFFDSGDFRGIKLYSNCYHQDEPEFGDLTLSTDSDEVSYQNYWYKGGWFENITVFWKDFVSPGKFKERFYDDPADGKESPFDSIALLSSHKTLKPGEKGIFKYIISWNFPNYVNYWNPGESGKFQWKNYYATKFNDSIESAEYVLKNFNRLYDETMEFKDTLFSSSFPDYIIDAIAGNIATLKTPTCLRLTDGTLYGFEGCNSTSGSCEGSCTHVWNYAQAVPFLFPTLERSIREADYKYNQYENGKMAFRMMLPPEREKWVHRAAADGQMGGIIKVYREWKISGNTNWLRSIWPEVKKALEYAWDPTNEDWWDKDCDGVIEGVQHHTLDVEIYGPNPYISGLYHAALFAAYKMADALGDNDSVRYYDLYKKGRKWMDENLFNGEYFFQKINLNDERYPIDPELKQIKCQIGEGCHVDQVLGQWHAHITNLGYIFDKDKVRKALESIYKYNFKTNLREYPNCCRVFALNDEKGLVICTWPKGNSPIAPVPYADECMNGFEYQAACHMIYEGLINEGLSIVKAVRERYDGERRNPWSEFEAGNNYARSMASYSLILALSGFEYDMVNCHIGFNPVINENNFYTFWCLNSAWGSFEASSTGLTMSAKYGFIHLNSFSCNLFDDKNIEKVEIGKKRVDFNKINNKIIFETSIYIDINSSLHIIIS